MDERNTAVGDVVVYRDAVGNAHNALVTASWGPRCVNLLYVSDVEDKRDPYGRQIERQSSSVHKSNQPAHGNYWHWPDEQPNPNP